MALRDSPLDEGAALKALEARIAALERANPLQRGTVDNGGQVRVAAGGHLEVEGTAQFRDIDASGVIRAVLNIRTDANVIAQGSLITEGGSLITEGGSLVVGVEGASQGDHQVAFYGVDEMTSSAGTRALALASNGVVVSVPWPQTGGGGGPGPIASSFMWPFSEASVTDDYGPRPGIGKGYHDGIDFGQATGTPIPAVGAGTVTDEWIHSDAGPYAIDIDHGNGFHSQYWHNSAAYVSPGQSVAMGDIIGAVGNLGLSYGAHLHLEIIGPGSPSGRYSWPWRDFFATYGETGV